MGIMRYLGIDYGKKKTGIAISDENGKIAFPKNEINTKELFNEIKFLILQNKNNLALVFGKSLKTDGKENEIQKEIRAFQEKIKREYPEIQIFEQDERFSTFSARTPFMKRGKIKKKHPQAEAATIILQRFLDKNQKKNLLV